MSEIDEKKHSFVVWWIIFGIAMWLLGFVIEADRIQPTVSNQHGNHYITTAFIIGGLVTWICWFLGLIISPWFGMTISENTKGMKIAIFLQIAISSCVFHFFQNT